MVTNWSRRPAKICRYLLSVSAAGGTGLVAAKVSQMSNVVRKIIDEHPDIDQSCYKKAAIKASVSTGITLEVVFYPRQKAESRQRLRAEFIMILMEVSAGLPCIAGNVHFCPGLCPSHRLLHLRFDASLTTSLLAPTSVDWSNVYRDIHRPSAAIR